MNKIWQKAKSRLRQNGRELARDEKGVAYLELILIFPILFTLLLGTFEIGTAIMVNQKTVAASQMVADLIARNNTVNDDMLNEAVRAAELMLEPNDPSRLGVMILSMNFDDGNPTCEWQELRNIPDPPDLLSLATELGSTGDGALAVAVRYDYDPVFGSTIVDRFRMQEITFTRGRRTAIITKPTGASGC